MKTENEFIAGVYEKYACEQEKRRKRVRTLSLCATLSACACVAVFVSLRIVPALMNANAETANDAAYVYVATGSYDEAGDYADKDAVQEHSYSLYADEKSVEDIVVYEAQDHADPKLKKHEKTAEYEENGTAEKNMGVTAAADDTASAPAMYAYPQAESEVVYGTHDGAMLTSDNTAEPESAQGISGSFEYVIPDELGTDSYTAIINGEYDHIRQSEYTAESGAVYGESAEGYYVYFSHGGDEIVLMLDADAFTLESAEAIAESMKYAEK